MPHHLSPHRSSRRCHRRPCISKHHGTLVNSLAQVVVCDSGDFATIAKYQPQDATTNPSLILAASKKEEYAKLIDSAVEYGKKNGGSNIEDQVDATLDNLLVQFGKEILKIIPGKVSTEVDARFSFDTEASVKKALRIIDVGSFAKRNGRKLTISSCTRSRASARSAFSSRSHQHGKASRPPRSSSPSTESTPTSPSCSPRPRPSPLLRPALS